MFESLDYRTMLFMSGLLAVALSVLLLATHARIATLHGLVYWVSANLLIGVAITIFIFDMIPLNIRALVGGLCIVFGLAIYYVAIRVFEQNRLAPSIIKKTIFIIIIINIVIALLSSNEYALVVLNTALCVVFSIMSALFLLKSHEHQQKSIEHRFTGLCFTVFAALTLYRLAIVSSEQISPVEHLTEWTQNEITFLACMLSVLAINFGFIAIVNTRIAEQLNHAAGRDWLTGVMNRGRLEEASEIVRANSIRFGQTQAMLLIDLDRFKSINDTYGHLSGDKVIKIFAELVAESVRGIDLLGRYGGEEFCVLMPNTNEAEAFVLAERIREKYEATPIFLEHAQIQCTVSIGVCDSSYVGNDFKHMFEAADKSLYTAKKAGRNKVIVFSGLLATKSVNSPAVK